MSAIKITINKACPRCGCKDVVARKVITWMATTYIPMCAQCGLGIGETATCTSEIAIEGVITDYYYKCEQSLEFMLKLAASQNYD